MSPALGAKHVLPRLASTRQSVYVALPLVHSETSVSLLSSRDQAQSSVFTLAVPLPVKPSQPMWLWLSHDLGISSAALPRVHSLSKPITVILLHYPSSWTIGELQSLFLSDRISLAMCQPYDKSLGWGHSPHHNQKVSYSN